MASSRNYLLVTPVKNEAKNIDKLARSVNEQSIKPVLWVIVDDNSDDSSPDKLARLATEMPFIRAIRFPEKKDWDIGIHYSEVCSFGFNKAMEIAEKEGIRYKYIALLDADIILEKDYFETLLKRMESDRKIGILSGAIFSWNGSEYVLDRTRDDLPRGAARLWRKECFEKTGGYLSTYSPDAVSNIKAILRGCKIDLIRDAKAYQTRQTSSAMGIWKGMEKAGNSAYFLHYPPIVAFMRAIGIMRTSGIKSMMAFSIGYFRSWVNRAPKLEDDEIREYNRKRYRDMLSYWLK